ncbi:trypsin-like serine protease [Stieleria sp. JC731]|uniref:trypsin-like serine protease n=1 Tax=Pirellulaceae TaxID=2691357 RepID=UPI001E4061DB|nr:trypsin-like serine protease [Stieleria sp. JC731]MCC9603621.1 trypsin-like serine protease [Stieleria sp. JC731]
MSRFQVFVIPLLLAIVVQRTFADEQQTVGSEIERWDRVVAIRSPDEKDGSSSKLCSAILVEAADQLFVVTAGHAAEETHRKSKLIYRDADGKSQWVLLSLLLSENGDPWSHDKVSDFAIAKVASNEKASPYVDQLKKLSISIDQLSLTAPGRTTRLEIVGFPLALGATPPVSPLVVVSYVASKEIESSNKWGKEPILYTAPPIAQGCSGGPAMVIDDGANTFQVVGIVIGMMADSTGAKLSKVVPARLIRQSVEQAIR